MSQVASSCHRFSRWPSAPSSLRLGDEDVSSSDRVAMNTCRADRRWPSACSRRPSSNSAMRGLVHDLDAVGLRRVPARRRTGGPRRSPVCSVCTASALSPRIASAWPVRRGSVCRSWSRRRSARRRLVGHLRGTGRRVPSGSSGRGLPRVGTRGPTRSVRGSRSRAGTRRTARRSPAWPSWSRLEQPSRRPGRTPSSAASSARTARDRSHRAKEGAAESTSPAWPIT